MKTCELHVKQGSFALVIRAFESIIRPDTGDMFFVFYYTSQNDLHLMRLASAANFFNDLINVKFKGGGT